jgi:KaiC/GvpD/RAD55 family RecA-like ATPase/DNA-binding response OmpR family regulator
MLSTGVETLDSRLGGIERRGHVLVLGPEGAGKSLLGMHFLVAGIERREPCVLVTSNERTTVDGRGMFLGFSPGPISEDPHLRLVDIREAEEEYGVAVHRNAPVEALRRVAESNGGASRIVIDDLQGFSRGATDPADLMRALRAYLEESEATVYLLASTANHVAFGNGDLEPIAESAAAVIQLEQAGRGRRKFVFRRVRQKAFSTEPFLYTLRSGGGFAEDLPAYDREVETELRRRVVILDESDTVPAEVITALSTSFELDLHTNLEQSLIELLGARYGVLLLAVDPYDPERAFNLTYTLRKSGNGAPILFISRSRGLRSVTRSRGLRMGGDDYILAELPPAEIVERIRITAERGHHRRNGSVRPDRHLQPIDDTGEPRPMEVRELRDALTALTEEAPSPFFAVAVLEPAEPVARDALWEAVRTQVRLTDGDLLSLLPGGRLALVLAQVDADLARKIIGRVRRAHPALSGADPEPLLTSPLQGDEVRRWASDLELEVERESA